MGFLAVLVIFAIVKAVDDRWLEEKGGAIMERWAKENAFTSMTLRRTMAARSPFFPLGKSHHYRRIVYRMTVQNSAGDTLSAWALCEVPKFTDELEKVGVHWITNCLRCGYGLSGLPLDTACPECGRATPTR